MNKKIHISEAINGLIDHFFSPAQDSLELINRFSAIQIDPISIVCQNQLLVLAARGNKNPSEDLMHNYKSKKIIETYAKEKSIILYEDAPLIWPLILERKKNKNEILELYKNEIADILSIIKEHGLISTREIASEKIVAHSNWGPKSKAAIIINLLWEIGDIIVASRRDKNLIYSIADKNMWLSGSETNTLDKRLERWKRYLHGVAIMDSHDSFSGFERCSIKERKKMLGLLVESGDAFYVDGINSIKKNTYIASKTILTQPSKKINCLPCFVPPLDNFIWNRDLIKNIWGLDYKWEIYTKPEKRLFGPYAMPLVTSSGMHGPIDCKFDKKNGALYIFLSKSHLANCTEKIMADVKTSAIKLLNAIGAKELILK